MGNKYRSDYAFPVPGPHNTENGDLVFADPGMELRDYFAAKMAAALIVAGRERSTNLAASAYWYADEMLKARSKEA